MPSTRDIRRRIKSVKGTAQITKAMQMVASSKMLKAQQGALNFRPFAAMADEIMDHLSVDTGDYRHPLMEARAVRKRAVILVGTDKGLCGALNSNLFREASKYDTTTLPGRPSRRIRPSDRRRLPHLEPQPALPAHRLQQYGARAPAVRRPHLPRPRICRQSVAAFFHPVRLTAHGSHSH